MLCLRGLGLLRLGSLCLLRLVLLTGLRALRAERLPLLRLTGLAGLAAERLALLLGARVAVTALRLGAVGLGGGGLGGGEEGPFRAGTSGAAIAAAARMRAATRLRMRPVPVPMVLIPPLLSKPPAGSKTFPSALHAANTVKAMPNWPRSRPATFGTCGRPWATTISAAPMMPARVTLMRSGPLPQALGMSAPSPAPSTE